MKASLRILAVLAVAALLAAPALADHSVIDPGSDLWVTPADGTSFTSFSDNPLPRGFFCAGSAPFSGKIEFRGLPLETQPLGLLGRTDTIVERLDEARFDEHGVATTRIQLRALSLISIEPVVNECGTYNVTLKLHGDQPTTIMTLFKRHAFGGTYSAPLSLNVRISFVPITGGRSLHVDKRVDLGPAPGASWLFAADNQPVRRMIARPFVNVDTDDIAGPDEFLPLQSNFLANTDGPVDQVTGALQSCPEVQLAVEDDGSCCDPNCHLSASSSHCTCNGGVTYY